MVPISIPRPPPPTAKGMACLSAADVLRRYGAGERDFRAANLRGLRLRGEDLSGADFSGADLRSTDFRDARLQRTNFSSALGGRQRRWSVVLFFLAFVMGGVAGALLGLMNWILAFVLVAGKGSLYSTFGLVPTIAAGAVIVLIVLFLAWEGPTTRGVFAVAVVVAVVLAGASGVAVVVANGVAVFVASVFGVGVGVALVVAGAGAGVVAGVVAGAGAGAGAVVVAVVGAVVGAVFAAIFGSVRFNVVDDVAVVSVVDVAFTGALILTIVSLSLSFWRSRQGAPGYASSRSQGVALGTMGGTNFRGADLRGAFLSGARLDGSNFASAPGRPTRMEQVCWKGARSLEWARLGGTILADPRIRRLLVEADGHGKDFSGLNLRGAYLAGADLRDAGFRNATLSGAILAGAHLEGANLAGAQCLGADFSEAHLSGACLEAWNIDSSTNLHGVDCAYVYLLEPHDAQGHRRDDHHRERLPHDPGKSFELGDLEAYFMQVLEEVKLLIRNGVDPKAFQHAFQEVMRQHPQITPQSLTGIKLIGNDVMATLQVPAGTDKAAIEYTFDAEYLPLMLENARLKGLLEGERRRADDHREHIQQALETVTRLVPATGPPPIMIENRPSIHVDNNNSTNATHTTSGMTHNEIKAGDGSFINTGSFHPSGGMVNLVALSDRARITIEAVPDTRQAADQPSLRELLNKLKSSIDADTSISDTTKADALAEVNELAQAAQNPTQNASLARRSINALKGLNEGIGESVKLANVLKPLLTLIATFF